MAIQLEENGYRFTADTEAVVDISIPLRFGGDQPNAFHLPQAEAVVARGGDFVGDTREGGSCNCETVRLNPHGNGTHTECIGHLTDERIDVRSTFREPLFSAVLVSVEPETRDDGVAEISGSILASAFEALEESHRDGPWPDRFSAMIIRTLPNDSAKKHQHWSGSNPPCLDVDAVTFALGHRIRHLLVDIPSLDREDDSELRAHRAFWGLPAEGHAASPAAIDRTITEMVFVPDEVSDGIYLVNLQVPPFVLDAAPSRPLLLPVGRIETTSS